jgi:hypothetical protein
LPQALLPLFPHGATTISDRVSVVHENGDCRYFVGIAPVFCHPENDLASFRMFTSQLVCEGLCKQTDIVRAFGVSGKSVKRYVSKYRQEGITAFYRPRNTRGATVITDELIVLAQERLSRGRSRRETAEDLGIKYDTLRKAINQGRLREPPPTPQIDASPYGQSDKSVPPPNSPSGLSPMQPSDKSLRSQADATAEMGVGCTRPIERVLAAVGLINGATTEFEDCRDVTFGGVLCALPALTANSLFSHLSKSFPTLVGYYTTLQVVILLAYMALCRIKTVEQLQYESPGELGKLLGLDRVPEVRCLRNKLTELSKDHAPEKWAGLLSKQWLEDDPDLAGTLYVDGHVRLYHGKKTELPKRYVSRQRLCLRGTTDYWVNDALGKPFFRIERPIDHGMLEALKSDIIPQLLRDVPRQPSADELKTNPHLCRFLLIFDREGYSPVFFKEMWQTHRIACITYHKFPKEAWPVEEFLETQVTLPRGETVSMKLAERGSWIGGKRDGLWVREVRKLNPDGHQTSLISTAYEHDGMVDASDLFSRWSQENFFRYTMEHYGIDLLSEYQTEVIPGTTCPVVNPRWREVDGQIRSVQSKLIRKQAEFAAHTIRPEMDQAALPKWEERKRMLREAIEPLEQELAQLKEQRKKTPHHLKWEDFPVAEKFERLSPSRKRLLDTVRMIAYRAETAMVGIVREVLVREDDARSLIRDLMRTEADLSPDLAAGTLTIRVHPMANPRNNRAIAHLLAELNNTESNYPGTTLKLVYQLVGMAPKQ